MATIYNEKGSFDLITGFFNEENCSYRIESFEEKPVGNENEILLEMDTGTVYYWSKFYETWKVLGFNQQQ